MAETIIICGTTVILYFGYLWYKQNNPYTDQVIKEEKVVDKEGRWKYTHVKYKRIYKNGTETFFTREE